MYSFNKIIFNIFSIFAKNLKQFFAVLLKYMLIYKISQYILLYKYYIYV